MLADEDFSVCATWRIAGQVAAAARLAELRQQARHRGLEGLQDALEQAALAARVELAQALERGGVEHRGARAHRAAAGDETTDLRDDGCWADSLRDARRARRRRQP